MEVLDVILGNWEVGITDTELSALVQRLPRLKPLQDC